MSNNNNLHHTQVFNGFEKLNNEPKEIILTVHQALQEKGYNPVNQIVGYLLSGDPTYITSYKNARSIISRMERDDLLEEIVNFYLNEN